MTAQTLTQSPAGRPQSALTRSGASTSGSATVPKRSTRAGPGRYLEVQGSERALLIRLEDGVLHIGRGLSAGLRLDENSVSRRHAILVPRPRGARILDDRSSNGTLVNGRRVQQADLRDGDVIVLGRVELRYLEV